MVAKRARFSLILTLVFAGAVAAADIDRYSQIRVLPASKAEFLRLIDMGLDILEFEDTALVILAHPGELQRLQNEGLRTTIEIGDLKAYYQTRIAAAAAAYGGFRKYAEILSCLDSLAGVYPSLITTKESVGLTVQGRDIYAVKISDNPTIDEDEPEVFYNSLIHAREPASAAALIGFMEYLLEGYGVDPEITAVVDSRELYFMPVINPDGYLYNELTDTAGGGLWRKNRRPNPNASFGVDLNRNFSAMWGYDNTGSSPSMSSATYRGPSPFSEPETQAVRDFVMSRQFVLCNNVHTYSNLFLYPPGFDIEFTPYQAMLQTIGDSATKYNGYAAQPGWALYPTNGAADDWMWFDTISKPRIISFTTEIGADGFWPDPPSIPSLVAENIWPNFFLAKIADNPYQLAAPLPPTVAVADSVSTDFSVSFSHADPINPAESYQLYALTGRQVVTEGVEGALDNWTGYLNPVTLRAYAGANSFLINPGNGSYQTLTARYPYPVQVNDSLVFQVWYDLENNYDYLYAQVSTDGGYSYENLPGTLTTNNNPNNMNHGNGMTGSSGGWQRGAFSLGSWVGQQVMIRLIVITDGFTLGEGAYIDEITPILSFVGEQLVGSVPPPSYAFADYTPGPVWFRAAAVDAQGQAGSFSPIVGTTVWLNFVSGDWDGDGIVDGSDIGLLVDYIFFNGPDPVPVVRMDVDCDVIVDGSDLGALVDYIFFNVSLPVCP